MTFAEVVEELEGNHKGEFEDDSARRIRHKTIHVEEDAGVACCPLAALCEARGVRVKGNWDYGTFEKTLGLSVDTLWRIVEAADWEGDLLVSDQGLADRKQLKEACL